MNEYSRNIPIVLVTRICFPLVFAISVITLFWQKYGLSLRDIFLLQGIFAVAMGFFEIPTGFLGDRIGRKATLLLASAIACAGWVWYSMSYNFVQFVIAEIVLGIAFSLRSGTDTSLLYESLLASGGDARFTRIEGAQHGTELAAESFAALTGSLLVIVMPDRALFALSGVSCFVTFVACLFIREPARKPYIHPRGTIYGFYKIVRYVFLRSKAVRIAVPLSAVCSLSTMLGVWLYQPLWTERSVPLPFFGLLWALLSVPSAIVGRFADRIERVTGRKGIVILFILPVIAGYIGAAFLPGLFALVPVYLVGISRGLNHPVLARYINEETFSDKRATVFSIASWLFRVLFFGFGLLVGTVGSTFGLGAAFVVSAVISAVLIGLLIPPFVRVAGLPAAVTSANAKSSADATPSA
jgi:MFS family permease